MHAAMNERTRKKQVGRREERRKRGEKVMSVGNIQDVENKVENVFLRNLDDLGGTRGYLVS